jgi:DNA-binding LytR/AlgR family response regulator
MVAAAAQAAGAGGAARKRGASVRATEVALPSAGATIDAPIAIRWVDGLLAAVDGQADRQSGENAGMNQALPRAVLADDERLMRDQLRARLAEVWPELQLVAEAKNGSEAVTLVAEHRPDIVFLDIRMPGLTGVEAAKQIAQMDIGPDELLPEIVFITAYDQYAVEAFAQGVADYVLKPAERERLAVTVERLKKRLALRDLPGEGGGSAGAPMQQLLHKLSAQLNPGAAPKYLQWIQASVGQAIQMIPVEDVLFFISDEKYTRVQTATIEALIRKPIKELIDELDPQLFWQIHRSTLVNVKAIASVSRDFRGRQIVAVKGHKEQLEVSRSYLGLFKGM